MMQNIRKCAAAAAIVAIAGTTIATASAPAALAAVPAGHVMTAASSSELPAAAYADQLVRAWGRGDRAATSYYATPAVTNALFAYADPGGGRWRQISVQGAAGTIYVTYHNDARGGTLTLGINDFAAAEGQPHAAYTARFDSTTSELPAAAYADQLVRAWGRGDRAATSYYATPAVTNALFAYADPGGGRWRQISVQGAAGTIYVTYHNDANGRQVVIGVSDIALEQGNAHAAYTVKFS